MGLPESHGKAVEGALSEEPASRGSRAGPAACQLGNLGASLSLSELQSLHGKMAVPSSRRSGEADMLYAYSDCSSCSSELL